MKTKNIKTVFMISSAIFLAIITLSSFLTPPDTDIIGIWVSEEDEDWTMEFTSDGKCFWNSSNEDTEVFTYTITTTTPQCGYQVKTGGVDDYYLKLVDQENSSYCYEILGVNNESLSISSIGLNVKNFYFLKQ